MANRKDINAEIGGEKSSYLAERLNKQVEDHLQKYKIQLAKEFASKDEKIREEASKKVQAKEFLMRKENEELLRKVDLLEKIRNEKELEKLKKDIDKELQEEQMNGAQKYAKKLKEQFKGIGTELAKSFTSAAEQGFEAYTKYYSSFATRLQNARLNVSDIYSTANNAALSPYFKITDYLSNISTLLNAGITENLTQRAFLASISDRVAATFDATQASLLEITRIQRQDTTAARLGLEAALTRLFNSYFGDTSYLANQFDNVQSILIGTSTQLGAARGISFEYQVQKWLGALGASGVSQATLNTIAQGINYLGTGNIGALSSNQSLQNLLVMAASRGGLNYTDILTQGMDAKTANSLLYGLISYVRDISGNNVVRAQYADIFGISLTDMKVIQDMSLNTLRDLTKSAMTYQDTLNELNEQLNKVSSRTHLSQMIDNVMSNILTSTGMTIASNTALYATYKAASMLESITGGIPIPGSALFTLNGLTFEQAIKTGIMGMGLYGPLMGGLNALSRGGSLNLSSYAIDVSNRDAGFRQAGSGQLLSTTSGTTYAYNENMSGSQQAIYSQQQEQAERISGEESNNDSIINILRVIRDYLQGGSSSYPLNVHVMNYGLTD